MVALMVLAAACDERESRSSAEPAPEPASGQAIEAPVLRVVDGDTIRVRYEGESQRVRYIGMNTPEVNHPERGAEPYGREATEANRRLVEGETVRLVFDAEQRDRYGRLLAYVHRQDGTFVNAKLVEKGYAQVMTVPPNVRHQELFLQLEREARRAERGLWGLR